MSVRTHIHLSKREALRLLTDGSGFLKQEGSLYYNVDEFIKSKHGIRADGELFGSGGGIAMGTAHLCIAMLVRDLPFNLQGGFSDRWPLLGLPLPR